MSKGNKVLVIGGGISGLTAGIYCCDSGFEVTVAERHAIVGGECTGWYRDATYIDGCAHWIIGCNTKSDLHDSFHHIGVFDDNVPLFRTKALSQLDVGDKTLTFYGDLTKLEGELTSFFPEDKKRIHSFIKAIRTYSTVKIPMHKPISQMNIFELARFGIPMLPMALAYLKYSKISVGEYVKGFKNPELRNVFLRLMRADYNMHAFLYILQALARDDAGIPAGGSLPAAKRVEKTFTKAGGKILYNAEIVSVEYEGKKAKKAITADGREIEFDYLVIATDINHAIDHLLPKDAKLDYFKKCRQNEDGFPVNSGFTLSYRIESDISSFPRQMDFLCDEQEFHGLRFNHIPLRNYSFDKELKAKNDGTLVTILLQTDGKAYEGWSALDREDYLSEKQRLLEYVRGCIAKRFGIDSEKVIPLDAATPLTYARYCNAYKGSYQSYVTTSANKKLMISGKVPGIDNVVLSGQWLMYPGGLPIAIFTGKHAAYRLCKKDGRRFIDNVKEREAK